MLRFSCPFDANDVSLGSKLDFLLDFLHHFFHVL